MLCADKGTSRSAQALPETEGATSLEHSSGASPKDIPDTCDSAFTFKQVPKAPEHQTSNQVRACSQGRSSLPPGGGGGGAPRQGEG